MNTVSLHEAKGRVEDLYARYSDCLNDDELERWPGLFAEQCIYKLVSRANHARGLPLAPIVAESRGALEDRVIAIRKTMVYAPRTVIHAACGVRILAEEGDSLRTRSVFSVHQTLIDGVTHLQMVGRSFDRIEMHADGWRFAERIAVYDTELIPGSVVYPV